MLIVVVGPYQFYRGAAVLSGFTALNTYLEGHDGADYCKLHGLSFMGEFPLSLRPPESPQKLQLS
jgi:hypothetical protein